MSLATRRCLLALAIGLIILILVSGWSEPDANGRVDSNVASATVKNDAVTVVNKSVPVRVEI